jgi:rhodanese-related sulfurtransferase
MLRYVSFLGLLSLLVACQSKTTSTETTAIIQQPKDTKELAQHIQKLPPQQFAERLKAQPNAILLDVRTPQEFAAGYIDGASNINVLDSDFKEQVQQQLPPKRPIFVYCKVGGRSARAAKALQAMGYTEIYDLYGGYTDWQKAATTTLPDTLKRSTY